MSTETDIQAANPNPAVDTEALRAALAAAAPRPWVVEHARIFSGAWNHNKHELLIFRGTREWAPDADLIVGAVNALPDLLHNLDAVLAIHTPIIPSGYSTLRCEADDDYWPCATARACGVTE